MSTAAADDGPAELRNWMRIMPRSCSCCRCLGGGIGVEGEVVCSGADTDRSRDGEAESKPAWIVLDRTRGKKAVGIFRMSHARSDFQR